MTDDEMIAKMIEGTELKVRDKNHALSQLEHLKKYHTRPVKRLASDTNLPEFVIRRFKILFFGGKL